MPTMLRWCGDGGEAMSQSGKLRGGWATEALGAVKIIWPDHVALIDTHPTKCHYNMFPLTPIKLLGKIFEPFPPWSKRQVKGMLWLTGETPPAISMGETTDTFTQSYAQGREGTESGGRGKSGRYENGPGAHKTSLVFSVHASATVGTNTYFLILLGKEEVSLLLSRLVK